MAQGRGRAPPAQGVKRPGKGDLQGWRPTWQSAAQRKAGCLLQGEGGDEAKGEGATCNECYSTPLWG